MTNTQTAQTSRQRFDRDTYQAALANYGLPQDYPKLVRAQPTGKLRPDGKPQTRLVFTSIEEAARLDAACWVQANLARPDFTGPKATNADISIYQNLTLDFEYPAAPELTHALGRELAEWLVTNGLAEPGLAVEDSGAGCHIVLPLTPIDVQQAGGGLLMNKAVAMLVNDYIKPEFEKLAERYGLAGKVKLEAFDISRIISLPGTWRPGGNKPGEVAYLREGYMRRWLLPCNSEMQRNESQALAALIKNICSTLLAEQVSPQQHQHQTARNQATATAGPIENRASRQHQHDPGDWLRQYAGAHNSGDRSAKFHSLVCAGYLKFDSQTVRQYAGLIDDLTGSKYGKRAEAEAERSLKSAENLPKTEWSSQGERADHAYNQNEAETGLKADIELNQPYLDHIPTTGKKATLLLAPKGSNKTGVMADLVAQNILMGHKTLIISHRVILAGQQAERMGAVLYSDFKGQEDYEQMSEALALVITPDSLPKLKMDSWAAGGFALVIDESEQVLQHLCGNTVRDNRRAVLTTFETLVKRAEQIILADADMSIISFELLAGIIERENIEVVINRHKPAPKEFIAFDQAGNWQVELNGWLDADKKLCVTTNSKTYAQALERYINTRWPELRVLRIDSDNSGSPEMQEIVRNINEVVTGYDVLICSPSAGTGLNIYVPHFDATFLYAVGKITTHKDLHQQAARVRQTTSNKVFCWVDQKKYHNLATDPNQLKKRLTRADLVSRFVLDLDSRNSSQAEFEFEARYLNLWANIKAAKHQSWQNLRANFYQQAESEGHSVTCQDGPKASGLVAVADPKAKTPLHPEAKAAMEAIKAAKEELRAEADTAKLNAERIDQAEYKKLEKKAYKLPTEKARYERRKLETFYGQEISQELIEFDKRGKARRPLQNYMEYDQPDRARERDQAEADNPNLMRPDRHHFFQQAQMRREILKRPGLLKDSDSDAFFKVFNSSMLISLGFATWARQNEQAIWDTLGIRLRSDLETNPVKLISEVLRGIGLTLQSRQYRTGEVQEIEVERADGTKRRRKRAVMARDYWIDLKQWSRVTGLAGSREAYLSRLGSDWAEAGLDWRDGIASDQAA